jgi:hypothetical protein
MDSNEPLEPMAPTEQPPPRRPSGLRTLIAGLAIAGVLTGVGAMGVLAASPQPSSSGAPTASDDGSGSGSGSTGDHVCPDRSSNGSSSGSGSSDSSSSS